MHRWVEPFAFLELAKLLLREGRLDEAEGALSSAGALAPRHFSFHSWHQSSVREAKRLLNTARAGRRGGRPPAQPPARGGGGGGASECGERDGGSRCGGDGAAREAGVRAEGRQAEEPDLEVAAAKLRLEGEGEGEGDEGEEEEEETEELRRLREALERDGREPSSLAASGSAVDVQ